MKHSTKLKVVDSVLITVLMIGIVTLVSWCVPNNVQAKEVIMLDVKQFRENIIQPVLKYLDLYSKNAEDLLVGTALQESKLTYLKQLGTGPALGIYQIEPNTHYDVWENYLNYRPDLAEKINNLGLKSRPLTIEDDKELIGNLYYATAICRLIYLRDKHKIPNTIEGMASYWKRVYNTDKGRGKPIEFINNYKEAHR